MDEQLYQASLKALTENGVSQEIAEKASKIVASDEPGKPNLGRTPEDQEIIWEAMEQLWSNQK